MNEEQIREHIIGKTIVDIELDTIHEHDFIEVVVLVFSDGTKLCLDSDAGNYIYASMGMNNNG